MISIILALALGILVGVFRFLPQWGYHLIDRFMVVILFLLIFHLAVGIGNKEEIFANLSTIGLHSFLLAAGAILGSMLLLWFVQQKWFRGEK